MAAVTINPKALRNDWLFHRNIELAVHARWNSTATFDSEENERAVVKWYRDRVRRGRPCLTEWSELTDPFEAAGREDWSPVRSVKLATPGRATPGRIEPDDSGYTQFLALRRERKQIAVAVAALLTGRTRVFRSDRGRPRKLKAKDVPMILAELHARMDAC